MCVRACVCAHLCCKHCCLACMRVREIEIARENSCTRHAHGQLTCFDSPRPGPVLTSTCRAGRSRCQCMLKQLEQELPSTPS